MARRLVLLVRFQIIEVVCEVRDVVIILELRPKRRRQCPQLELPKVDLAEEAVSAHIGHRRTALCWLQQF